MPSPPRKSVTQPPSAKAATPEAKPPGKRTPVAPARKAAPKAAPRTSASLAAEKAKDEKARKPKLVRDSFTIPKTEYAVIEALKARAAKSGAPHKKSELLRAGIKLLATLDDAGFTAAMQAVPAIKTGRPAKA